MTSPAKLRNQARLAARIKEISALRHRTTFQTPKHHGALGKTQQDMRVAMIVRALHEAPCASAAARNIGMDRRGMHRDFKFYTGLTIQEYLAEVGPVKAAGDD